MKSELFLILGFLIFTSATLAYADIPNEYSDLNHFSDITFNESANSITIQWDFTDDIIQSCHLQTNLDGAGYTAVGFETYRFNMVGLDFENKRDGPSYLSYNLDSSEIDCKGEYTINIDDIISYTGAQRYNFEFFFGGIINDVNRDKIPIDFFKEYDTTSDLAYTHTLGYEYNEYGTYRNLSCSELYGYFDKFMHNTVIIQDIEKDTKQSISYKDCIGSSDNITAKKKNSNDCSGDCTPPTFGKDKQHRLLVTNGFELDGNDVNVEKYHVPYDLITVNTGQTYNMKLKVYENTALRWIQVGFGIPEVGSPMNDAEVIALFQIGYDDILDDVEIFDNHALIDVTRASLNSTSCSGDIHIDCYILDFDFTPREQIKNNVILIQAVDMNRNIANHYINDGMLVIGDSMNDAVISKGMVGNIAFYPQRAGTVELTLTDYKTDTWKDIYGYLWEYDHTNKTFRFADTISPLKKEDVMWSAMTRMNSNFADMIIHEQQRAMVYYPPEEPFSDMKEPRD